MGITEFTRLLDCYRSYKAEFFHRNHLLLKGINEDVPEDELKSLQVAAMNAFTSLKGQAIIIANLLADGNVRAYGVPDGEGLE
jgi:hypothetical protein